MKKNSMIIRFLSLALCAVLLLGMVPVFASAQTSCSHEDGVLWAYPNDNNLTHTFIWNCCGGAAQLSDQWLYLLRLHRMR